MENPVRKAAVASGSTDSPVSALSAERQRGFLCLLHRGVGHHWPRWWLLLGAGVEGLSSKRQQPFFFQQGNTECVRANLEVYLT